MTDETFLETLGFKTNEPDIDHVERQFVDRVKERIQTFQDSYDEEEVKKTEEWLTTFYQGFFQYSMQWAHREMQKKKDVVNHPDAPDLKKAARAILEDLQKHIIEVSFAYMHINRFMTLLRDEIKREEIRMGAAVPTDFKWTSDTGDVLTRYKKQKKNLIQSNERIKEARHILESIEDDFILIKKSISSLLGKDKSETYVRRLMSAFRMADFKKARNTLKDIGGTKKRFGLDQKTHTQLQTNLQKAGGHILQVLEDKQDILEGADNKLYLRVLETSMIYNAQIRELKKIRGFLAKYHLPYMQYKLNLLQHLKEKLLVIGSLENLMTLYKRLISGVAQPLASIKDVRLYESKVLGHVTYLLDGHFQETTTIVTRANETVQEFRDNREDFEEFSEMELEEITVDNEQDAG